jgi:predicted TIM-barrel fold metal-dependent hydrolase
MTKRVDAHQHFWSFSPIDYPWIDDAMLQPRRDRLPRPVRNLANGNPRRWLTQFPPLSVLSRTERSAILAGNAIDTCLLKGFQA